MYMIIVLTMLKGNIDAGTVDIVLQKPKYKTYAQCKRAANGYLNGLIDRRGNVTSVSLVCVRDDS